MIDEKRLIEGIKQCFKNLLFGGIIDNETMWLSKEICNIIDLQQKTDWIPCSERLPSEKGEYLICDDKGNVYESSLYVGSYGCSWLVKTATDEVIAWQPLPQPYKKEGAE